MCIDDFLAYGSAAESLIDIVTQSGATLVGMGFVIEKSFQEGGKKLRDKGIHVEALARIEELTNEHIKFCDWKRILIKHKIKYHNKLDRLFYPIFV